MNNVEPSSLYEASEEDNTQVGADRWRVGWRAMLLAALVALGGVAVLAALAWGYVATSARVRVTVDGMTASVLTHKATVDDLLTEMELKLAPEDHLTPPISTPLVPGLSITVQRARPVLVHVDGRTTTVPVHGQRDISPSLIRKIAQDIGLAADEFVAHR